MQLLINQTVNMEKQVKQKSGQRYVDILSNGGFKAFFGDENNKKEVMSVINVFLPEHRRVIEIEYLPTEHQGPIVGVSKEFHYDFMCKDESGTVFIVEMQRYRDKDWFKRCVSYASRVYDRQNREGEDYDIPPVYLIGLMGVEIDHPDKEFWRDHYVSEYTFIEKKCHDLLGETIVIIFVELANFSKEEYECHSELEKILYLLKNSGKMQVPPGWYNHEDYDSILRTWEINGFDEDKRIKYDSDMYDERRRISELKTARLLGKEEGREEGRKEGERKANLESAKKLKELGVAINVIAEGTGLPVEVIENL